MENELLDSFYFKQTVNAIEHDYRITNTGEKFEIEKDGILIAELTFNESWEQVSGTPLGEDLISAIGDRIDDHYL